MNASAFDDALARIACTRQLLVALDFDGTLAPLVDEPMSSRMIPAARTAIEALAALPRTTVALVSGRTLEDLLEVSEHLDGSPIHLAGSHGAQWLHPGSVGAADDVDADGAFLVGAAEAVVVDIDGAWIEPKRFGLGVHTRLAAPRDAERAVRLVDALIDSHAPHWRRRIGKDVVEYASRHEGKDTALGTLRELSGATGVLFAGDDVTDEDALRSLSETDLGIHVGSGPTAASFSVPDVTEMAGVLGVLSARRGACQS